ncbi:hypothetical protein B0H11DRAFT_1921930 [Mycena galericulata]|nr:hypothetical protein B0H11DRAFT_1921930 [Mycena galericulata]
MPAATNASGALDVSWTARNFLRNSELELKVRGKPSAAEQKAEEEAANKAVEKEKKAKNAHGDKKVKRLTTNDFELEAHDVSLGGASPPSPRVSSTAEAKAAEKASKKAAEKAKRAKYSESHGDKKGKREVVAVRTQGNVGFDLAWFQLTKRNRHQFKFADRAGLSSWQSRCNSVSASQTSRSSLFSADGKFHRKLGPGAQIELLYSPRRKNEEVPTILLRGPPQQNTTLHICLWLSEGSGWKPDPPSQSGLDELRPFPVLWSHGPNDIWIYLSVDPSIR